MFIGYARTSDELDAAIELAAQTFHGSSDGASDIKRGLLSPVGNLLIGDVVVLVIDEVVCGSCFFIDRDFFFNKRKLKGTFFSSICIHEENRGQGLSVTLMDKAISLCSERGSFFAALIARRAVDNFYTKFSFWGISQYSKIHLNLSGYQSLGQNGIVAQASKRELNVIGEIYECVYSRQHGSSYRTAEYWLYILWKAKHFGFYFFCYKINGEVKGYAICNEKGVYELAVTDEVGYLDFLMQIGVIKPQKEFLIHCADTHPIVTQLRDIDFTLSKRQCIYGGHMIRVINEKAMLKLLYEDLQQEVPTFSVDKKTESSCGGEMVIKDGAKKIKLTAPAFNYENTCFLMRARNITGDGPESHGLKNISFNIPYFDQI